MGLLESRLHFSYSAPIESLHRVFLDPFCVLFNSFALRITHNMAVDPKRDFGVGMAHLLLYDCWRDAVCHHLAGRPVPCGMEAQEMSGRKRRM